MAWTDDDADDQLNDTYGSMPTLVYALLNCASGGVALLAWLAVLQLIIFHAGLISRGMTTYEFIVAQVAPANASYLPPPRPPRAALLIRARACGTAPSEEGARRGKRWQTSEPSGGVHLRGAEPGPLLCRLQVVQREPRPTRRRQGNRHRHRRHRRDHDHHAYAERSGSAWPSPVNRGRNQDASVLKHTRVVKKGRF